MNTDEITDEQVLAFLAEKTKRLSERIPKYVLVRAELRKHLTSKDAATFTAYSEIYGWTDDHPTADEAIAELLELAGNKTPEQMRRDQIEALREKLLRLEAESLPA